MKNISTIHYPFHLISIKTLASVASTGLFLGVIATTIAFTQQPQELRSRATNNGTVLALNPSTKSLPVNQTTILGITINTNDDSISAVELHLTYDKTAIQVTGFTAGTILPVVLKQATTENGAINILLGTNPTSPFKGGGILGTITIKTLANKQSAIMFTNATAVAAIGKATNALASKAGSTVTGTIGVVTPTPTPIKTPTPIPKRGTTPTPITNGTPTPTPAPTSTPEPPVLFNPLSFLFPESPTPTPESPAKPSVGFNDLNTSASPEPPVPTEISPSQDVTVNNVMTPTPESQNIFVTIILFFQNIYQGLFNTR